ncbi:hypothetical protein ACSFCW_22040 [Yokenella regensburgei]|uniref:hypothetical protein n=1 Tax=Enterobacteriaceae TaxID=543 RepID=UPI0024A7FCF1|nr:hypothetical protein [Klebsiella pneumoniae]HDO7154507.1 hypothetical protein [Klebsiella pneumoniae]
MPDVIQNAEQVKDVLLVTSSWMPVISTLAGGVLAGCVALLVSWVNHRYAREREAAAAAERLRHEQQLTEDKRQKELLYISTELVFVLERFAEGCAKVASDDGERDTQDFMRATQIRPELDLNVITGDWRALGPGLTYAIRELPVLKEWSDREIAGMEESEGPPDYTNTMLERKYLYARLGLKAILQARRLRKLARLPDTRLDASKWSAQPVLWRVWRYERKRRAQMHILRQRELATFHIMMQQRIQANRHSEAQE